MRETSANGFREMTLLLRLQQHQALLKRALTLC